MPNKKRSAEAVTAEEYESDGGFVEDVAPKSKRSKVSKSKGGEKDGGGGGKKGGEKGKDGEVFWELSGKRRVGIQEFAGKKLINIREFYEKDGVMLPSKKGISLSVDQFNNLVKLLPQIETALKEKGERIERPSYEGGSGLAEEDDDGDGEEEVVEKKKAKAKRNFEETSEEE